MESMVFVAGLAVLLVVLHVAVAAYLYRVALGREDPGAEPGRADDRHRERSPGDGAGADPGQADAPVPCPTCGTPNDPGYRFCRRCVADLTGEQRTAGGAAAGRLGS